MTALLTGIGLLVILATLRDIVHELFSPQRSGSFSRGVMRAVWFVARRIGRRWPPALEAAGPAILVSVALMWMVLLAFGWSLIYLPRLPSQFHVDPVLPPWATHGFVPSLYISLSMLTSAGFSDMTPVEGGLRIAATLEAFVGLAMLTAWITWVLSIYPVLAQRRAFAREVQLVRRSHERSGVGLADLRPDVAVQMLRSLTEQVIAAEVQLGQTPVTYYFQEKSADTTLGAQLSYLLDRMCVADDARADSSVRHHATLLRWAIEDLLAMIGRRFLDVRDASGETILHELARDHLRIAGRGSDGRVAGRG